MITKARGEDEITTEEIKMEGAQTNKLSTITA